VLEMAAGLPRPPRVLFVSTSHVYDAQTAAGDPVNEETLLKPKNGYGWSKWLAETVIDWFTGDTGLDVVVARSFQHTGPRQHERMMLPQWARQFALPDGRPVEVFNRSTRVDLSDVRDIVRAYRLLAVAGEPGAVYNVGSGRAFQTGDVLEMLRLIADPTRPIRELHPGLRRDAVADISRLAAATGWQPQIPLEQCVADTFDFWKCQARA
jgi:GDP-4-dehydro-6-deoxy-D-mannose reductase